MTPGALPCPLVARHQPAPRPLIPEIVFGEPWDGWHGATVLPETPTYVPCRRCGVMIAEGDQGVVRAMVGPLQPEYLVGGGNGYWLVAIHRGCI